MAEVIAKKVFGEKGIETEIISRGLSVPFKSKASANSQICVSEMGLSLEGFYSNPLTYEDIEWADVLITMTSSHKNMLEDICREKNKELYTLAEAAGELTDVSDPFGADISVYRSCALQIKSYIEKIGEKMTL